jgi:hypothetical protein
VEEVIMSNERDNLDFNPPGPVDYSFGLTPEKVVEAMAEAIAAPPPEPTARDRVIKFLDDLSERPCDTFEAARAVRQMLEVFAEVDWLIELEAAADRQVLKYPNANSMDLLVDHVAAKMRYEARKKRRAARRVVGVFTAKEESR